MRDSDYDLIKLFATEEGLAVITMNRPDVHNAFNMELIAELTDAFRSIADETSIRMVILRGAGKSFSAGADLEWMKRAALHTKEDNVRDAVNLAEMLRALWEMPQMTLAMVQGAAMGGGAGLVAACDVAVAMKDAHFRFSEVRLG
ncbi:MAG: enoyl-CoA hydratase/isomerase family protein, partial [Hyphomonas sp.]|nr:enoyl-CoA hydratase/isomerase family protein [Hyphomonas sp.]